MESVAEIKWDGKRSQVLEVDMITEDQKVEEEIEGLKKEIEEFHKEKERVRAIVGSIGGVPSLNTKFANIVFILFALGFVGVSLVTHGTLRLAMIEAGVVLLSLKFVYLIHNQARVNHFQLWILSSIEWQINDLSKRIPREDNPGTEQEPAR